VQPGPLAPVNQRADAAVVRRCVSVQHTGVSP
jgi:hypothetical protein